MLAALAQPVAALGLAGGFLLGLGLRVVAQRLAAIALGIDGGCRSVRAALRADVDPLGAVSALLSGVGWGRGRWPGTTADRPRLALAVAAGPLAALVAGQLALAAFTVAYPGQRVSLVVNRPSDVLHGVVVPTRSAQLVLSVAVALLCFGLLALLPIPPLDGSRLLRLAVSPTVNAPPGLVEDLVGSAALLVLTVIPLPSQLSPLLTLLDLTGTPLLRLWT